MTEDERTKIVTEARHRDMWVFMLSTGLRVVEVCRLEAADVRIDSPSPHVAVLGKGDKPRTVELSRAAVLAAHRLLEDGGGRVWPGSRRDLHRAWVEDREALGLSDEVTPHVFRHDFASALVNDQRLPLPDVQRLLGHADLTTTAIYLHPDGRRTRVAVEGRGESLDGNELVTDAGNARGAGYR